MRSKEPRPLANVQGDDRDQHEQAAGHRVDDELQRGPAAVLVAVVGEQEVERDQHPLPEEVEEQQVDAQQHAGGHRLGEQQQPAEQLEPVGAAPRDQQRAEQEDAGVERQEPGRDAVEPEVVRGADRRDPAVDLRVVEAERPRRSAGLPLEVDAPAPTTITAVASVAATVSALDGRGGARAGSAAAASDAPSGHAQHEVSQGMFIAPPARSWPRRRRRRRRSCTTRSRGSGRSGSRAPSCPARSRHRPPRAPSRP